MGLAPLRRVTALTVALQVLALPVHAVPVASIRWGACPNFQGVNRYDPSSSSQTISVTATGLAGAVRGFYFIVGIGAGGSQVSDAWRFDPGGCQAGRLSIGQPANVSCPPLRGTNAYDVTGVDYVASSPGGRERILHQVVFQPFLADPAKTYTLARIDLDHTNAVEGGAPVPGSCPCLDRSLCISLLAVVYQDGDGQERSMAFGSEYISWNDEVNSLSCPVGPDLCHPDCSWTADTTCVASVPTAAAHRTWGGVKGTYR